MAKFWPNSVKNIAKESFVKIESLSKNMAKNPIRIERKKIFSILIKEQY